MNDSFCTSEAAHLEGRAAQALTDDALDAAVGGMSCTTARAVATTYNLASDVLHALGNTADAIAFRGQTPGVLEEIGRASCRERVCLAV